jgi:nucleotide-binding universal stress UspA family protein
MEKLTRILTVVDKVADGPVLLEKSVALARNFGAHVDLLLHDSLHTEAFATLCTTLHYREVTLARMHAGSAPLHEVILRCARLSRPDLIIKAPAGAHPLKYWTLDETDRGLVSRSPVPVLLVRQKAWSNPVRFAAAVDVSDDASAETARSILHSAGFLALGCHGQIDILYGERERNDERVRMARAVKLAQLVREFHVGSERLQRFDGPPAETLPPIVEARHYDVMVLGAFSHQPRLKTVFGSMTSRLVDATDGDVLLVKAPAYDNASHQLPSRAEQRSYEREQLV